MTAAAAVPLISGTFQLRPGRGAAAAAHATPNKGSVGAGGAPSSLANSQNDNVRDLNFSSGQGRPRPLLVLGLRPLGHCPLQYRPPAGMEWVHLLTIAVLAAPTAGGGVEGSQLGQALLFGRESGLEGVGEL